MMSEKLKGRTFSDETKRKIGLSSKGRIPTEETRKKMSLARKGRPSIHKGKKMFNNGIIQQRYIPGEEPKGYVLGTLKNLT